MKMNGQVVSAASSAAHGTGRDADASLTEHSSTLPFARGCVYGKKKNEACSMHYAHTYVHSCVQKDNICTYIDTST